MTAIRREYRSIAVVSRLTHCFDFATTVRR
jgi:hypothetical protein